MSYTKRMLRIATEQDLIQCFRERDQGELFIPYDMHFPLGVKDYISWLEPSGARTYLVFEDPVLNRPVGIVFHRSRATEEARACMCDWCHSVRPGREVRLLSAEANSRQRVGVYLCSDLSCMDKLKDLPGTNDLRESLGREERIQRLLQKMSSFAHKHLF